MARRTVAWRCLPLLIAISGGVLAGLGGFTFGYGQGASYLTNNPASCANCHVMQGHFDGWLNSSHHAVANCNDCHLPHDPVGKWVVKADNGFFHSLAFTTGRFHEPIQIKPRNRRVTQAACVYCHRDLVDHMLPPPASADDPASGPGSEMLLCVECHADVGHAGRR